jgi:hypothetical protein
MMSDHFDKPSKSEDEYFHRRDRELLEQKRRAEGEVAARQALASTLGITNDELMRRLTAQGITPELTVLLPWLPAIQVAWLKSLTSAERDWLVDHIKTTQTPPFDAPAQARLQEWLSASPSEELYLAARQALALQIGTLGPDAAAALRDKVLNAARGVSAASGGILGIGSVSSDEKAAIDALARQLGEPV